MAYLCQNASFISPAAWGLAIGLVLGTVQQIDTAIEPLAEDTPGIMLGILSLLLILWTLTSYVATRRTDRFADALLAGLLVGLATMIVLHASAIVRVNVFLDTIQYRDDWANLVTRYHASTFRSLRAFANYEYLIGTPLLLMLGAGAGTVCGVLGGTLNKLRRTA